MKEKIVQVCVVGGGIAGVSAAISASRAGASVTLIEREYVLGGLATLGLIVHFLPLCNGHGKQVSFGIAQELLELSASIQQQVSVYDQWMKEIKKTDLELPPRYRYTYNPSEFSLLLEEYLLKSGVEIRYGSQVYGVNKVNDRVVSLDIQGKDTGERIYVKNVVDATGEATIFQMAGMKTETYENGNIPASWYYMVENGKLSLRSLGAFDDPDKEELHAKREGLSYQGVSDADISEFVILAHKTILRDYISKKNIDPNAELAMLPMIPQFRMVRRIVGCTLLKKTNNVNDRKNNSVGLIGDWRKRGPVYEIPFDALICSELNNVIAAGRCISADSEMWDITRVIPACAVTGEAAGLAASIMNDIGSLSIMEVQSGLRKRGIPLHFSEIK